MIAAPRRTIVGTISALAIALAYAGAAHGQRLSIGPDMARTQSHRSGTDSAVQPGAGGSQMMAAGPTCHLPVDDHSAPFCDRNLLLFSADDFVPDVSPIDTVTWFGAYYDNFNGSADCGPGPGDDFQIRIYADAGGLPGTLVSTHLVSPTKVLSGTVFGTHNEYQYVAALDPAVPVSAGQCHWMEITNDTGTATCQWLWSPGGPGNQYAIQDYDNGIYEDSDFIFEDLAFCVASMASNDCGPVLGSCCGTTPGTCTVTTSADCIQGRWMLDGTCDPNPCAIPANNACASASPIFDGVTHYDTYSATTDGPAPTLCDGVSTGILADIWYTYTATCTGELTVSLCTGTERVGADPVLALYGNETPACACPAASPLVSCANNTCITNPNFVPYEIRPVVSIPAAEGNCYLVRIGSLNLPFPSFDQGFGRIEITCSTPCETAAPAGNEPAPIPKSRFLSFVPGGSGAETAIRIKLVSLHHVNPPYTGGVSIPFTVFEGEVRWVGPPAQYVESTASAIPFLAAQLQCDPYYQDWSPVGLLHVTGSAIVPSSIYDVQRITTQCDVGVEDNYSETLTLTTSRWGDVVDPQNPPSLTVQPDISDVSSLVDKFRNAPGAPSKARGLLAGEPGNPFGEITHIVLNVDFGFSHISSCVDAFRGVPYPYTIQACP